MISGVCCGECDSHQITTLVPDVEMFLCCWIEPVSVGCDLAMCCRMFWFDASNRGQLSKLPLERHVSAMLRVPADPVSVSLQRVEGGLHCSLLQERPQSV